MNSHFRAIFHLTDPNGGPGGQNVLGLWEPEPKKPHELFFLIAKIQLLALSATNEIPFWDNDPSL